MQGTSGARPDEQFADQLQRIDDSGRVVDRPFMAARCPTHMAQCGAREASAASSAGPTLNEFGDANNDQRRRNEHRLRTQCPEDAGARESCNGAPKAIFRNPAFDHVVRHH